MNNKKLFINSDVLLDVFLERKEFYESSAIILSFIDLKKIDGFTSSLVIANLYYILRKEFKSSKTAIHVISELIEIIKILNVDEETIKMAIKTGMSDFEDSIQYIVAKKNKMDFIITRNIKDFKKSDIKAVEPVEILRNLKLH